MRIDRPLFLLFCLASLLACASCSSGSSHKGEGSSTDDDDMTSGDDSANDDDSTANDDDSTDDQAVQYDFAPTRVHPLEIWADRHSIREKIEISAIAEEINDYGHLILTLAITIPPEAIDGSGIIDASQVYLGASCLHFSGSLMLRKSLQGEVLQDWRQDDHSPDGTYYPPTYQIQEVALTFVGGTHTRIKMVLGPYLFVHDDRLARPDEPMPKNLLIGPLELEFDSADPVGPLDECNSTSED